MKAFAIRAYGSPDMLELADIDQPVPRDDEVLVRVRATSVQPYDWHIMRGEPRVARLMGGVLGPRGPKIAILGGDVAGTVEAVGSSVTEFRPGDDVFAMVTQGGFAEYVCIRERELAPKPANLSFEEAAAIPLAANTAMVSLRDVGRLQAGQKVLVNGASGGVGTFAVQIAHVLGAQVTGVCSARNVDMVRSIGAADVIDYTAQDFTRGGQRHDLMLDIAGSRSAWACRRVLTPNGRIVVVGGPAGRWLQPVGHILSALAASPFMSQKVAPARVGESTESKENLIALTGYLEDGRIVPVIDRKYSFDEIPEALRYQEKGRAAGKVVVSL